MLQNHSLATLENKPVTITIAQAINKLTKRVWTTGKNHAYADFLCLLLCTASYFYLRDIFTTHIHFYYLNSSIYSPFQLLASYFSWNYFKKKTKPSLSHNSSFQEMYLSAYYIPNTFGHSSSKIVPILVLFVGEKNKTKQNPQAMVVIKLHPL